MSPFFIKHPVIATVIAVVTTLLGMVCLVNLPISQYPEITPRTIQLMAMFPGADAQVHLGNPFPVTIATIPIVMKLRSCDTGRLIRPPFC